MMRIALVMSFCLAGCWYDSGGVPGGPPDADAAPPAPPDAAPPDAGPPCHHVTHGLILGDLIPQNLYENGREYFEVEGNTLVEAAVPGATVGDQLAAWITSPERGDPAIDWIYLQCGINDVIAGSSTAHALLSQMAAFLEDIHTNNPHAVVFFGAMGPARSALDTIPGVARYPLWLEVQAGYANLGARFEIAMAMSDDHGDLAAGCDSGDHVTPVAPCDRSSALILRNWIEAEFPDVACAR